MEKQELRFFLVITVLRKWVIYITIYYIIFSIHIYIIFKTTSEADQEDVLKRRKAENTNKATKLWTDCLDDTAMTIGNY